MNICINYVFESDGVLFGNMLNEKLYGGEALVNPADLNVKGRIVILTNLVKVENILRLSHYNKIVYLFTFNDINILNIITNNIIDMKFVKNEIYNNDIYFDFEVHQIEDEHSKNAKYSNSLESLIRLGFIDLNFEEIIKEKNVTSKKIETLLLNLNLNKDKTHIIFCKNKNMCDNNLISAYISIYLSNIKYHIINNPNEYNPNNKTNNITTIVTSNMINNMIDGVTNNMNNNVGNDLNVELHIFDFPSEKEFLDLIIEVKKYPKTYPFIKPEPKINIYLMYNSTYKTELTNFNTFVSNLSNKINTYNNLKYSSKLLLNSKNTLKIL